MPELNKRKLAPAILDASTRLLVAQRELSAAMADLVVPGEPDATIVTDRLRLAFSEVAAAKQALAVLVGGDL